MGITLRDELLAANDGDAAEAAAILALGLTRDEPTSFKVGYSIANAILSARELFPEVEEDKIRFLNGRYGWMAEHELGCNGRTENGYCDGSCR